MEIKRNLPPGAAEDAAAATDSVADYIHGLTASPRFGQQVTWHQTLPETLPVFAEPRVPWNAAMQGVFRACGIERLYCHQAESVDRIRAGRDIVVATPTASGKSLVYNLPVIEKFLHDRDATALYLFPLKALAQDQLQIFQAMTAHWPEEARPAAAIYDGDTSSHFRRKIRNHPPSVLITNPEMLHLGILPHHAQWTAFLASLSLVVVDEVHTYRGILGAHMAQVFRRLTRIASLYGARPSFVACSATIGNPAELCSALFGKKTDPVLISGGPQGKRHFVFVNPEDSPATTAIQLLRAALARNLRTIVYAQSRRMTELISLWAARQSGRYASRISAYRAGFLPEERREIERRMASGELLAVISTSALELGIDIGSLDVCILVGYPGSTMATLQRGGRVGRSRQESAVVLIAQEDALDQYIVRNAKEFFKKTPEKAVVNPDNPVILERHLECAASEHPLKITGGDKEWLAAPGASQALAKLEAEGVVLRSADGATLIAARKRPQRHVALRGTGRTLVMQDEAGKPIGSVDGHRALREAHPGAVYLHKGRSYIVKSLNLPECTVYMQGAAPLYYTRARGNKSTEILSTDARRFVCGAQVCLGRLRVTETITGYEKRSVRDGRLMEIVPLDMPPQIFATEGLWFTIADPVREHLENNLLHFMGAIHAVEHAAIGIFPLLVMADRNDLGGISIPMHPQLGLPAIFIYDGLPGGAGLTRQAYSDAEQLFARTLDVISGCPCDIGCPSCVHSPKCGSGNRPIDKRAAQILLETLLHSSVRTDMTPASLAVEQTEDSGVTAAIRREPAAALPRKQPLPRRFAVLDVETRRSAAESGGWSRPDKMGVSVAVVYDSGTDSFTEYEQHDILSLARDLACVDMVIGFNILRFDYKVLEPHAARVDWRAFPTLDMLDAVHAHLSYRVSLDNLVRATLGAQKSADGLMALQWWKEGALDKIRDYCRQDVALTRDLYLFGRENGYVLFTNKARQAVRIPARW